MMTAPTRVVMAKTSLDGHWRGITIVERALREAGFEVIALGMATVDEIVAATIQEDADLLGLNLGGRPGVVGRIREGLSLANVDVPIMVGGVISPSVARSLNAVGIETFPPGSSLEAIVEAAARLTRRSSVTSVGLVDGDEEQNDD